MCVKVVYAARICPWFLISQDNNLQASCMTTTVICFLTTSPHNLYHDKLIENLYQTETQEWHVIIVAASIDNFAMSVGKDRCESLELLL